MKLLLPALAAAAVAILAFAAPASATNNHNHEKVYICHGLPFAASHDYNLLHVSAKAVDGEGKNDHSHHVGRADRHDDIIPAPTQDGEPYCPETQTTTTTVPPTTTTTEAPPATTTTTSVPVSPTTTVVTPTTTLAPPTTVAPVRTSSSISSELAATGATELLIALAVGGAVLLVIGAVVAFRGRA